MENDENSEKCDKEEHQKLVGRLTHI